MLRSAALAAFAAAIAMPAPAGAWGAISVSDNARRAGSAYGHGSEREARREAASECGGCDFVVTFDGGCVAYAHDPAGGWGWSQGHDLEAAQAAAKRRCAETGGLRCRIRVWACEGT